MALISEELTAHTTLDKGLSICSSRRLEKTCPERLAYEGSSYSVMTAETNMYFEQELPSLLFRDTPLKDPSSTSFVQFTLMHFKGFRAPNYAPSFILIVEKLLPIKVGQEWFSPGSDNSHDLMSRGCYLYIRTPDGVGTVFGSWVCD